MRLLLPRDPKQIIVETFSLAYEAASPDEKAALRV
jgi:hypothetical protein